MPDIEIIDMPQDVLKASRMTWTAADNNGYVESGFTGAGQVQRGHLERFRLQMEFSSVSKKKANRAKAFFLRLQGSANLVRLYDPCAVWSGCCAGDCDIITSGVHAKGSRELIVCGLTPSQPEAFKQGEWLNIGGQLVMLRTDSNSDPDGCAKLDIFPKVHREMSAGTLVSFSPAKGLFRMVQESPSWDIQGGARTRPYTFRFSGFQEVLYEGHPALDLIETGITSPRCPPEGDGYCAGDTPPSSPYGPYDPYTGPEDADFNVNVVMPSL